MKKAILTGAPLVIFFAGALAGRASAPAKVIERMTDRVQVKQVKDTEAEAQVRELTAQLAEARSKVHTVEVIKYRQNGTPEEKRTDTTAETEQKTATTTDTQAVATEKEHAVQTLDQERRAMRVTESKDRALISLLGAVQPRTGALSAGVQASARVAGPLWLTVGALVPTRDPRDTIVTVGVGVSL